MPIFFRNTPLQEPFTLDSAGFDWHQEPWDRPDGYPLYHYLQTEQGCGSFAACGRTFLLTEGDEFMMEYKGKSISFAKMKTAHRDTKGTKIRV